VDELPNLGKREVATARHFIAFALEHDGKFLVQQRPANVVNAHLWEFPNIEVTGTKPDATAAFQKLFGVKPRTVEPLRTVKHSITRYRITLEAFCVKQANDNKKSKWIWLTPDQMQGLAFASAHRKVLRTLVANPNA
jgi:adenine-specific DNA glycosylase